MHPDPVGRAGARAGQIEREELTPREELRHSTLARSSFDQLHQIVKVIVRLQRFGPLLSR